VAEDQTLTGKLVQTQAEAGDSVTAVWAGWLADARAANHEVRTGVIEVPGRAQHNTPQGREGLTRCRDYLSWPSQRFQHARELAQPARRRRRDIDICSGPSAGDVGQEDDAASRPSDSVSGRKRIGLVEAQFLGNVDGRTDPPPNFAGGDSTKGPRCTGPLFVAPP
jgi:hypothetical protein